MSKRDIKAELNNNSIIGGFIAPQEPQNKPKTEPKTNTDDNTPKSKLLESEGVIQAVARGFDIAVNGYKYKNGKNTTDNYALTFKIDADLDIFLKNIEIISVINTMESGKVYAPTKNEYVNDLIRADLKKRLGIKASETNPSVWIDAFKEYCKKYGIKDK